MSASQQASVNKDPAAAPPNPLAYPRKNKWLQDDGHLVGLVRRKGEKDRTNYNVKLDAQFGKFAPEDWDPLLPPLTEKKKKEKEKKSTSGSGSSSSSSGSGKDDKEGLLGKLMFWKKKGKVEGKRKGKATGGISVT
ncbi:hypothetical protein WAI453_012030 [Rhynchosporium graminicola]